MRVMKHEQQFEMRKLLGFTCLRGSTGPSSRGMIGGEVASGSQIGKKIDAHILTCFFLKLKNVSKSKV